MPTKKQLNIAIITSLLLAIICNCAVDFKPIFTIFLVFVATICLIIKEKKYGQITHNYHISYSNISIR